MKKLMSKKNKGFTLIELMIVIAIIAILAAILVPNFLRARAQSQLAACESNEKNIATSLEMYSTDNSGNYPTAAAFPTDKLVPTYMRAGSVCPANNAAYAYTGMIGPAAYTVSQGLGTGGTNPHVGLVNASASFSEPYYSSMQGLMTK